MKRFSLMLLITALLSSTALAQGPDLPDGTTGATNGTLDFITVKTVSPASESGGLHLIPPEAGEQHYIDIHNKIKATVEGFGPDWHWASTIWVSYEYIPATLYESAYHESKLYVVMVPTEDDNGDEQEPEWPDEDGDGEGDQPPVWKPTWFPVPVQIDDDREEIINEPGYDAEDDDFNETTDSDGVPNSIPVYNDGDKSYDELILHWMTIASMTLPPGF